MLPRFVHFFGRLFGYGAAKRRQREIQQELADEAHMHREASRDARHALSQLERKMQVSKDEAGKR